jgi:hypothetical protein
MTYSSIRIPLLDFLAQFQGAGSEGKKPGNQQQHGKIKHETPPEFIRSLQADGV